MTLEEARAILKDVLLHVDLVNLGRTVSALGEYEYTWTTFDNSKWRPNKPEALRDAKWLADHAGELLEALKFMETYRG